MTQFSKTAVEAAFVDCLTGVQMDDLTPDVKDLN